MKHCFRAARALASFFSAPCTSAEVGRFFAIVERYFALASLRRRSTKPRLPVSLQRQLSFRTEL